MRYIPPHYSILKTDRKGIGNEMDSLEVLALSFTNRCNLRCVHCGCDFSKIDPVSELPVSFFTGLLKEAKELGAESVNITGGEAFCRPDCLDLVENAVGLGYYVTLESNGTLFEQSHIERLAALGNSIRLSLSIDGITAEVNDAIRGDGTFARVMDTALRVSKTSIPARVITVVNSGNLAQIPDLARYVVDELGFGFRLLPNIMEYGRGVYACHEIGAQYDAITKLLEGFYYDFLRERNSDRLTIEMNTALIPIDITNHHICPWGKSMLGVGPTGIASLCHVSNSNPRFIFGDIKNESLRSIWENNTLLNTFRNLDTDDLGGVCGNCLAREICRGGCRVHAMTKYNGDINAPSPPCQTVYELGRFPYYAMEDENKDCSYIPKGED